MIHVRQETIVVLGDVVGVQALHGATSAITGSAEASFDVLGRIVGFRDAAGRGPRHPGEWPSGTREVAP